MSGWTRRGFLHGLAIGAACGIATILIAVVTGVTLVHMQRIQAVDLEATPTAEQLQRALEILTKPPDPGPSPPPPPFSVGGTLPTPVPVATTQSGTPVATPASSMPASASTPLVPSSDLSQPTPAATSQPTGGLSIPTITPFVPFVPAPVVIQPVQPIGTPRAP